AVTDFATVDPVEFDPSLTRKEFDECAKNHRSNVKVVSHEALSSRPHHGFYYAPEAAKRLKQTFPEASLLIIFREQRKIIYSLYGEHIRNGGRHHLREFIGSGNEPAGWNPLCRLSFFKYDQLLKMYNDVFGKDKVLALPLELLSTDKSAFAKRFFEFLGLPLQDLPAQARSNPGWTARTYDFYRMTNGLFRKNPLGPASSTSYRLREKLTWRLNDIIPKSLSTSKEKDLREFIDTRTDNYFCKSNAQLSEMLGIDLGAMGYKT
ncbi:MAG: hypothetical protein AAF603_07145, partial [Pseudomonadota bacterium]